MDILFLDANILFSAAYRNNAGLHIFWKMKKVKLVSSYYALEEAERNLDKKNQKIILEKLIETIEVHNEYDETLIPSSIDLRKKDRPILAAAIGASANYLITGDARDFGKYFGQSLGGVLVLPPSDYLKRSYK